MLEYLEDDFEIPPAKNLVKVESVETRFDELAGVVNKIVGEEGFEVTREDYEGVIITKATMLSSLTKEPKTYEYRIITAEGSLQGSIVGPHPHLIADNSALVRIKNIEDRFWVSLGYGRSQPFRPYMLYMPEGEVRRQR